MADQDLAISRLLLEAHCGQLLCKLNAEKGKGYTEFILELPLAYQDNPALEPLFRPQAV